MSIEPIKTETPPGEKPGRAKPSGDPSYLGMSVAAWELVFKVVGSAVVVVGAVIAYLDFRQREEQSRSEQRKAQDTKDAEEKRARDEQAQREKDSLLLRQKEFRLNLHSERYPLFTEVCDLAGKIAAAGQQKDEKSVQRFWELYYGRMCLVEDKNVEEAMIAFGNALESKAPERQVQVRVAALRLAGACKQSMDLKDVYGVELSDVERKIRSVEEKKIEKN